MSKICKVLRIKSHCFESTVEREVPYQLIVFSPEVDTMTIGADAFTGKDSLHVMMSPTLYENLGLRIQDQKLDDSPVHTTTERGYRSSQGLLLQGNKIIGVLDARYLNMEQENTGFVLNIETIPEVEE